MEAKERTRDRGQLRIVGLIHYLNVVFKELPALLVHLCLCLERGIGAGMSDAAQGTQQEWQGGGGGGHQTNKRIEQTWRRRFTPCIHLGGREVLEGLQNYVFQVGEVHGDVQSCRALQQSIADRRRCP